MEFTAEKKDYLFSERMRIIFRCVFNRCPRCSHPHISHPFKFPDACPHCGMIYERNNGFLLTALPAVYFGYALFWVVPMMLLFITKVLSFNVSMWLVGIGAVLIPILFFNYCKMLALALYYFFLPTEMFYQPEAPAEVKPAPPAQPQQNQA